MLLGSDVSYSEHGQTEITYTKVCQDPHEDLKAKREGPFLGSPLHAHKGHEERKGQDCQSPHTQPHLRFPGYVLRSPGMHLQTRQLGGPKPPIPMWV